MQKPLKDAGLYKRNCLRRSFFFHLSRRVKWKQLQNIHCLVLHHLLSLFLHKLIKWISNLRPPEIQIGLFKKKRQLPLSSKSHFTDFPLLKFFFFDFSKTITKSSKFWNKKLQILTAIVASLTLILSISLPIVILSSTSFWSSSTTKSNFEFRKYFLLIQLQKQ